jgi:aldehyde dehydrogenase (NAD+)
MSDNTNDQNKVDDTDGVAVEPAMTYDAAREDVSFHTPRTEWRAFVDGESVVAADGAWFESANPATDVSLGRVAYCGAKDVDIAVRSAQAGQKRWGAMESADRAEVMYRISRILQERAREFAVLETLDNGKSIRETRDIDVPLAAEWFFSHAGWCDKLEWTGARNPQPHGVVGAVVPWNFPLLMAAWKVAPALAGGNSVVLKPAETTPLTALLLAEVCRDAGLPNGALNVIPGYGDTGEALMRHPGVSKLAFTGSTAVGKKLRSIAGDRPLTLELGGKGSNIVFADCDIDAAVEGVVWGIYMNQGHVCCAGSRLIVQESIHDEFVQRLEVRMARIRVGDPMDKNTDMGAINSAKQADAIRLHIARAVEQGAEVIQGVAPERSCYIAPTMLVGVHPGMNVWQDEVFGPVLSVSSFRTAEEAVEIANRTRYGLANGVWSSDGARAMWVSSRLRSGVVWLNTYNMFDSSSPFGGVRESGYGREGGVTGMRAYVKGGAR